VNDVVHYPIDFLWLLGDVDSHFRLEPAWDFTKRENLECVECIPTSFFVNGPF
jgi:hypothetical protein